MTSPTESIPTEESLPESITESTTEYDLLTYLFLVRSCTLPFANEEDRKDWVIIQTQEQYERNLAASQIPAKK